MAFKDIEKQYQSIKTAYFSALGKCQEFDKEHNDGVLEDDLYFKFKNNLTKLKENYGVYAYFFMLWSRPSEEEKEAREKWEKDNGKEYDYISKRNGDELLKENDSLVKEISAYIDSLIKNDKPVDSDNKVDKVSLKENLEQEEMKKEPLSSAAYKPSEWNEDFSLMSEDEKKQYLTHKDEIIKKGFDKYSIDKVKDYDWDYMISDDNCFYLMKAGTNEPVKSFIDLNCFKEINGWTNARFERADIIK